MTYVAERIGVDYPPAPRPVGTWLGNPEERSTVAPFVVAGGLLALWFGGLAYLAAEKKREGVNVFAGTYEQHRKRANEISNDIRQAKLAPTERAYWEGRLVENEYWKTVHEDEQRWKADGVFAGARRWKRRR